MIGNDIVDLKLAKEKCNWRRNTYLDKLFNSNEKEYIDSSLNQDVAVWSLWSMKEAAYKIIHRHTKKRFYNPKKLACSIVCQNGTAITGNVFYGKFQIKTRTTINKKFVHSLALFDENVFNKLNVYMEDSSLNCESKIKQLLKKDDRGIPYVLDNNDARIPASLSHHGLYTSLVFPSQEALRGNSKLTTTSLRFLSL